MTNECGDKCYTDYNRRYTSNLENSMRVLALRLLITSKFLAELIENYDINDDKLEMYYDYICTTMECFDEYDMKDMNLDTMIKYLTKKIHECRLADLIPLGGVQ